MGKREFCCQYSTPASSAFARIFESDFRYLRSGADDGVDVGVVVMAVAAACATLSAKRSSGVRRLLAGSVVIAALVTTLRVEFLFGNAATWGRIALTLAHLAAAYDDGPAFWLRAVALLVLTEAGPFRPMFFVLALLVVATKRRGLAATALCALALPVVARMSVRIDFSVLFMTLGYPVLVLMWDHSYKAVLLAMLACLVVAATLESRLRVDVAESRWCHLSAECLYDTPSVVWREGEVPTPVKFDLERRFTLFYSVPSNFAGIPAIMKCRSAFCAVSSTTAMLTSGLYHACDSLKRDFVLSTGSWHRLDDLWSIGALMAISCTYCANASQRVQASLFAIAAISKELGPWNVWCTVAPCVVCVMWCVHHRRVDDPRETFINGANFTLASIFLLCGLICFGYGLSEERDWGRAAHSVWHIFAVSAAYFYLK